MRLQTSALLLVAALLIALSHPALAANNVGEIISTAGANATNGLSASNVATTNPTAVPFKLPACVYAATGPTCRLLLQGTGAFYYRGCYSADGACTVDKTAPRVDELVDAGPTFRIPWFRGMDVLAIACAGTTTCTVEVFTEPL